MAPAPSGPGLVPWYTRWPLDGPLVALVWIPPQVAPWWPPSGSHLIPWSLRWPHWWPPRGPGLVPPVFLSWPPSCFSGCITTVHGYSRFQAAHDVTSLLPNVNRLLWWSRTPCLHVYCRCLPKGTNNFILNSENMYFYLSNKPHFTVASGFFYHHTHGYNLQVQHWAIIEK